MKISISNIAWTRENDTEMYRYLQLKGIQGVEIAPTRIFPLEPYEDLEKAASFATKLKENYNLVIPSIQSIWFGRKENIFNSAEERKILVEYTKKAIDFASAIGCGNLVFGCPRNRAYSVGADIRAAVPFFEELGEYAWKKNTVLSMEANPPIYNTNYCNSTLEALELVETVASKGFKINLDVGTMIQNEEDIRIVEMAGDKINHVHISEPGLAVVERRAFHKELAVRLQQMGYNRFVSLEMKTQDSLESVKNTISYLREVFG